LHSYAKRSSRADPIGVRNVELPPHHGLLISDYSPTQQSGGVNSQFLS
jgi:hypothetical protein